MNETDSMGAPEQNGSPGKPFPAASSEMVQVVDYEEQFNSALNAFLSENGMVAQGFDYHVASILGAQSSGKSTLLNLLFGTRFCTMDESSGRYQVTQGVWLGLDPASKIMVLDLEGADSRERGGGAANFERKIALFALALSEVLIVNVWAQDVGRYNAANMDLLKTVMELDLQLFFGSDPSTSTPSSPGTDSTVADDSEQILSKQRMHKTRLLFVLRDHVSSPFETLCDTLRTDVNNIWDTISKPKSAANIPVTDFFDIDFFALPHKILMAADFEDRGSELRRRFQEGDVFEEEYRSGIAADGFSAYAHAVWETIRANRELDIPSQKEMLAHVRCEEIAKEALEGFDACLVDIKTELQSDDTKIVPNLVDTLISASESAMFEYRNAAYRYSTKVADGKYTDLGSWIGAEAKALLNAQVAHAVDTATEKVRAQLAERGDEGSDTPWKGWNETRDSMVTNALGVFTKACGGDSLDRIGTDSVLAFMPGVVESERRRLEARLNADVVRVDGEVRARGEAFCVDGFARAVKAPMESVVDAASENVWERASEVTSAVWEETLREVHVLYGGDGMGLSESEQEEAIEGMIKPACHELAVKVIRETIGSSNHLLMRMTKRFDDAFRFDERGVPRHFGPTEDVEALFVAARDEAEGLVDVLAEVRLQGVITEIRDSVKKARAREAGEATSEVVLSAEMRTELREKLKRQAGAVFIEVKRAQEAARVTSKVPVWLMVLLLMLGWNEFVAVVSSPILLFLSVVLLPVIYVAYVVDAPTLLGPAIGATVAPYVDQAKGIVQQFTESGDTDGAAGDSGAAGAAVAAGTAAAETSAGGDKTESSSVYGEVGASN